MSKAYAAGYSSRQGGSRAPGILYDDRADAAVKSEQAGPRQRTNGYKGKNRTFNNSEGATAHRYKEFKSNSNGVHKVNGVEYKYKSTNPLDQNENKPSSIGSSGIQDKNSLRSIIKLFDQGEKRQWPLYLHEMTLYFRRPQFSKDIHKRYLVDDVTKVFARILTTKLFSDIIDELVLCMTTFAFALNTKCRELLNWMFNQYETSADEAKIVLLKAFEKIIENGGKGVTGNLRLIADTMADFLEDAESSTILLKIIPVQVQMSQKAPHVFQDQHFLLTVDILFYWIIERDAILVPAFYESLKSTLIDFGQYWVAFHQDTIQFLNQFNDDFKTYTSNFNGANITKMASIIGAYFTVFKGLGEYGPRYLSWTTIYATLRMVLKASTDSLQENISEPLIIQTNEYATYIIHLAELEEEPHFSSVGEDLVNYSNAIQGYFNTSISEAYAISSLTFLSALVKKMNASTPITLVKQLLQANSPCQDLRFLPSTNVQASLFALHRTLLSLRNVPLLEETYKHFLLELKAAFRSLIGENMQLVEEEEEHVPDYTKEKSLIVINSTLVSLSELASTANSIITMHSLKPTLFELIVEKIDPGRQNLLDSYPEVAHNLLILLKNHSIKHKHFISSSDLITKQEITGKHNFNFAQFISPPSSSYLVRIFKLNYELLCNSKITEPIRLLLLDWIENIFAVAAQELSLFLEKSVELTFLVKVVAYHLFSKNRKHLLCASKIILSVLNAHSKARFHHFIDLVVPAAVLNLTNSDEQVRNSFLKIMNALPINCDLNDNYYVENSPLQNRELVLYPQDIILTKQAIMRRDPNPLNFPSTAFKSVIEFVLNNEPKADDWLKRLFMATINSESPIKIKQQGNASQTFGSESSIIDALEQNQSALIFWACWQLVEFCISNKLRTPLGKAQDTFLTIETKLKSLAKMEVTDANLLQVQFLLMVLECLDKQLYNVIEGSSSRLYNASKVAKSFFRTNRNTCIEWMYRQRFACAQLAQLVGDYATVWRHSQELLKEYASSKIIASEHEKVLTLLVDSLINLKAGDTLIGFFNYAKVIGLKCTWIKPAIEEANGREEVALTMYSQYLQSLGNDKSGQEDLIYQFVNRRILACYQKIANYEQAARFSAKLSTNPPELNLFGNDIDLSYLSRFETNLVRNDAINEKDFTPLNLNHVLHNKEHKLLNSILQKGDAKNLDNIYQELTTIIETKLTFGPTQLNDNLLILHRMSHMFNETAPRKSDFEVNQNVESSSMVNIIKWAQFDKSFPSTDLNLLASRAARKQDNCNLSLKYLLNYSKTFFPKIDYESVMSDLNTSEQSTLKDLSPLIKILDECSGDEDETNQLEKLRIIREGTKLLTSLGDSRQAVDILTRTVQRVPLNKENSLLISKMYLCLAKHFQLDMRYLEHYDNLSLLEFIKRPVTSSSIPVLGCDYLIGDLLAAAGDCCSENAKAWFSLADWYYRRGRKFIDFEENEVNPQQTNEVTMTNIEEGAINFYKNSANGYLKFLALNGNQRSDRTVQSTLRILRLISKHCPETEQSLKAGLEATPSDVWHDVIIQLFTKLISAQNDEFVSQIITSLICRIAERNPHLVVFRTITSSLITRENQLLSQLGTIKFETDKNELNFDSKADDSDSDDQDSEELNVKLENLTMNSKFAAIMDFLTKTNPQLINQSIVFIKEIRRITVLWDELWLGTLLSKQTEFAKKLTVLENELKNLGSLQPSQKINIMKKKFTFLHRIVNCLEETCKVTCDSIPETSYEKWFQTTFTHSIRATVNAIKDPSEENLLNPKNLLVIYQQLIGTLKRRGSELNSNRNQLIMDTISPILANLSGSAIPIPGLSSKSITVYKVMKTVTTLHTKTMPKKASFFGSDGQLRTFLFKGHEDLNLDERIMQFLSICNKLFARGNKSPLYRARNYSVTPLGTKSGLIEWVDGGTPLYSFYKRYLLNVPTKDDVQPATKPSEIFLRKLSAKGVNTSNRAEWPVPALIQVFKELAEETPCDLITKELWCASTNAHQYWTLTQNFIRSNAVMSIIGYILGLGDRHLDNILLDLNSGEVVHVDYNVCFEKGKQLRVPEKVPFRLTNNIVTAFGLTGVEGTYRTSCENILKIMRLERETLLTLLEAFVHDPLVDWYSNYDLGQRKLNGRELSSSKKYAASIWKRIKTKLEGRDPDLQKRGTVQEQVDFIIREALSMESLALMYEGWTSWV